MKFGILSLFHIAFKTKFHMLDLPPLLCGLIKSKLSFINGHVTPGWGTKIKSQIMKSSKFHDASNEGSAFSFIQKVIFTKPIMFGNNIETKLQWNFVITNIALVLQNMLCYAYRLTSSG